MACEDHIKLANYVKITHQRLRKRTKEQGFEAAWAQHCSDHDILQKYADCMSSLATQHWQNNNEQQSSSSRSSTECRIEWVYNQCCQYFVHGGKLHHRMTQERKLIALVPDGLKSTTVQEDETEGLILIDLLDVGSCYNPFRKYPLLRVLPIDIAPGREDVIKCDFLRVGVTSEEFVPDRPITNLKTDSFDVIVFSLFLEYFPDPQLRFQCCSKAYKLLKCEGLLFIITPDSKHATANAPIMRKWRIALATLGFWRISYEKLKHLHCMAFCKSRLPDMPRLWAEKECKKCDIKEKPDQLVIIPQDSSTENGEEHETVELPRNSEDIMNMFEELPNLG